MPLMEIQASRRTLGPNTPGPMAGDERTSAGLVQAAAGKYLNSVLRGNVFTVCSSLIAAPTGVSPLGAAGTPVLALYNPLSSGVWGIIRKVAAITTATGTVSPKGFVSNFGINQTITQTTVVVANNHLIGKPADSKLKAFSAVALTGSTALALFRPINGVANAAAQNSVATVPEDLNDDIVLDEGAVYAIVPLVAGTANEVMASITYEVTPKVIISQ